MSSSFALEWVQPGTWTAADLDWLAEADKAAPAFGKLALSKVLELLQDGKLHLFRYVNGSGIVLTEVVENTTGLKRLLVLKTAGKNAAQHFPAVAKLLSYTAMEWGCEAIETMVYSSKLAKVLQRVGAKPESITMVLEVGGPDGQ